MLMDPPCRKTGVSLKDTGVRDEHGMQPLDDVFSSPDKESQNGVDEYNEDDESEEEPMDIDESKLDVTRPKPCARRLTRPPPLPQLLALRPLPS